MKLRLSLLLGIMHLCAISQQIPGADWVASLEGELIKKSNEYRLQNGRKELLPDTVLYGAARHHALYLASVGHLSHHQEESKTFRDPQLRVDYFGGHDMYAGENTASIDLYSESSLKNTELASDEIMKYWKRFSPDNSNFLVYNYDLFAVAAAFDSSRNKVYVVMTFGDVYGNYDYRFCSACFPQVDLAEDKKEFSFKAIELEAEEKYDFGLKMARGYEDCPPNSKEKWAEFEGNLTITRDEILLCSYNLGQVRNFFRGSKDGLAVELLNFDNQYSCENELDIEPNTRNGFSYLDGQISKPVYRKEIEKQLAILREQASKRKKKKGEKMCNYFKLGPTPEGFTNQPYSARLHYIKNKRFCTTVEFEQPCGDILSFKPSHLPLEYEVAQFDFKPQSKTTEIVVQVNFERNQVEFNKDELLPILREMENREYVVNSIVVDAFASVEGSEKANKSLFQKRAKNLVNELKSYQNQDIKYRVISKENWELFYKQIDTTDFFRMRVWKKKQVKEWMRDSLNLESVEYLLKEQRKATITLTITPVLNSRWKQYMASSEWKAHIAEHNSGNVLEATQMERLDTLLQFLQYHGLNDTLFIDLARLKVPDGKTFSLLQYRRRMYNVIQGGSYDAVYLVDLLKKWNKSLRSPEVDYNIKALIANNSGDFAARDKILLIKSLMADLKARQGESPLYKEVELWFHIEMCELLYKARPGNYLEKVQPSLDYVMSNYMTEDSSELRRLHLAKHMIAFSQYDSARKVLEPIVTEENTSVPALKLMLTYCMNYEKENFPATYFAEIKRAYELMSSREWCSMFIGPCKIPHDTFDWPSLRSLYCESCLSKSNNQAVK